MFGNPFFGIAVMFPYIFFSFLHLSTQLPDLRRLQCCLITGMSPAVEHTPSVCLSIAFVTGGLAEDSRSIWVLLTSLFAVRWYFPCPKSWEPRSVIPQFDLGKN